MTAVSLVGLYTSCPCRVQPWDRSPKFYLLVFMESVQVKACLVLHSFHSLSTRKGWESKINKRFLHNLPFLLQELMTIYASILHVRAKEVIYGVLLWLSEEDDFCVIMTGPDNVRSQSRDWSFSPSLFYVYDIHTSYVMEFYFALTNSPAVCLFILIPL